LNHAKDAATFFTIPLNCHGKKFHLTGNLAAITGQCEALSKQLKILLHFALWKPFKLKPEAMGSK